MLRVERGALVDVAQAADQLGVSTRTLFRLLESGLLEPAGNRGRGKKLFFKKEDITSLEDLLQDGPTVRQLQPRQAVQFAGRILDSCNEASLLVRRARDKVLDSLEILYRASHSDDVYRLLKAHGRTPHDD